MTGDTLKSSLETLVSGTQEATVLNPRAEVLLTLIDVLAAQSSTTVRILAEDTRLRPLRQRFLQGTKAADLLTDGRLALRSTDGLQVADLVLRATDVSVIVPAGEVVGTLQTSDDTFVDALAEECRRDWEAATRYDIRQPALSEATETLGERLCPGMQSDFLAALDVLEATDQLVDEQRLVTLLGARNEVQQYELSRWAEEIGLASIATMSRIKQALQQQGQLETENVQVGRGRGRPRERLTLPAGADTSVEALVDQAVVDSQ